jgi:chemotaxis protein methyltransferase CheR
MIAPDDYEYFRSLLHRMSGLALGDAKQYLVESRLAPLVSRFGYPNLTSLLRALRAGASSTMVKAVTDAMTTGETRFFRDTTPFTLLREQLLPTALFRARAARRPVRLWSAGCATGQEAYSIAMVLSELESMLGGHPVEILATDYSSTAIARAQEGLYNQFEVQRGLPVQYLVRHFDQDPKGYRVKPALRRRVDFKEHNLLRLIHYFGCFDVIFCRNVLIYFDEATKRSVLERLASALYPGGLLMLGGTEHVFKVTDALERIPDSPAGLFRRPGDAGATVGVPAVA